MFARHNIIVNDYALMSHNPLTLLTISANIYVLQCKLEQFVVPESPENNIGKEGVYMPFAAAVDLGVLDPSSVPSHSPQEALDQIRNGYMPPYGAVVDVGSEPAAFDLLKSLSDGTEFKVMPTPKAAVCADSDQIIMPGDIVYWPSPDKLKVIGRTLTRERATWLDTSKGVYRGAGRLACQFYGLDSPEYDVEEVTEAGIVIATPRRRYY